MFYSHEILSNAQYGVSTIWLVATVGKGSQRKLNRKRIQGVNVPKACEKIIDPGAPLALRLQGNLLYGVSRVFAQQCNYVLSDAEKTQSDMMTFFNSMNTSETDPKAGKTKRQHIMLEDDPQFDPLAMLPRLEEILSHDNKLNVMSTQESGYKFSQMSPLDNSLVSSAATSRRSSIIGLDLPPSSLSVGSYQLPGNLCNSSPFNKAFNESEAMQDFRPFADEEHDLDPMYGMGLDFDANGNLVNIMDTEPQLPPLRATSPDPLHTAGTTLTRVRTPQKQVQLCHGNDDLLDFGEAALPDAEPFAVQPAGRQVHTDTLTLITEKSGSAEIPAVLRASRRRKVTVMVDQELRVSREEFRGWSENYVTNMAMARKRLKGTTLARARKIALLFMYNNGISGIGNLERDFDIEHPLATDFMGTALKARILGLQVDQLNDITARKGRRRKSPEAFGEEEDNARNVRQRRDHEDELGRGEVGCFEDGLDLGDDSLPEVGMGAQPALEDKNSSSLMPWSRQGSAAPGSATRPPGSAQKSIIAPSPLHGRGSLIGSIERHSDPLEETFPRMSIGSQPSSVRHGQEQDKAGGENDTQASMGLDVSNQDFLDYVVGLVNDHGAFRSDTRGDHSWITFEQLADPAIHSRAIAAQAFLHILSLATKNVIFIEQDGIEEKEPFGALHIGFSEQNALANMGTVKGNATRG